MKLSIDQDVRDFHVSKTILESFIDTVFQEKQTQTILVKIFLVVLGSSLITLSSYITIPLYPVPVTAQTLVILLIGLSYGSHLAFLTIGCYLLQGAMGMPVFAGGAAGLPTLIGPTGGYLVGFLAAGVLLGALASRGFGKTFVTTLIAMVAGNIVIYGCGAIWLAQFIGIESAVNNGVLPFLYGDLLKILIAAALLPAAWRILSKFK
jgi:biotin transport system substrate-specific component